MAPATTNLELPSAQALQSIAQMKLLDAVDALRSLGASDFTALPQLIVCGDQSSGKSSVLEAISGVPFPRRAGVCTRFATEVILRRDRQVSMKVSIMPSEDLSKHEQERLQLFQHDVSSKEDFADLFEKAKEAMGISDQGRSFSKSILRAEFRGPQQPQLTLVDLPGLIHARAGTQTKEDIQLVNDLVSKYLSNPRGVILAVVSARNDFNNQVITEKVRDVDPQGKRALGIITKPDTVNPDEIGKWIKLANNQDVKFDLGWHMIKNLDLGAEIASQETRDEQETDFFETSSFSVLPSQNLGIANLRIRLSKVLFHQIQTTLPMLLEDIENRIRTTKAARDRLGPSRATTTEQVKYLIELSQSFYTICLNAIGGNYDHEFFKGSLDVPKRLCANLMNKHFEFANKLNEVGASWKITDDGGDSEEDADGEIVDEAHRTRNQAIKEACKILKRTRGSELPGLSNPHLVGELFRDYSRPWKAIAQEHIMDVWNIVKEFLELVLHYLADEEVCDKILRFWLDPIMAETLEAANSKLNELLEVHEDHPMTLNPDFVEGRRNIQRERNELALHKDMDMVAAEDAFDNMNAYYQVAMKLFMDNVPILALRAPLIKKIPGMLSPKAVSLMNPELVTRIAGESEDEVLKRQGILSRLEKLEAGARICREYALRPSSISHPSEGANNVKTPEVTVGKRAAGGKSSSAPGKRHSPSISEDGRATARNEEQTSRLARSTNSGNNLGIPGADAIPRPASTGWSFAEAIATNNRPTSPLFGGLQKSTADVSFGQPSTSFKPFGNSSDPKLADSSALASQKSTGLFGTTGFGSIKPPLAPEASGSSLFSGGAASTTTVPSASNSTPKIFTFSPAPSSPKPTGLFANLVKPEVRRKNDIFKTSDIVKMKSTSSAPTTHQYCRDGLPPFKEIEPGSEPKRVNNYQSITFSNYFRKFSYEELRLADYADGRWNEIQPEKEGGTDKVT